MFNLSYKFKIYLLVNSQHNVKSQSLYNLVSSEMGSGEICWWGGTWVRKAVVVGGRGQS